MARLTEPLLLFAFVLGYVQITNGYSYSNCIEDPYSEGQSFKCTLRREKNLSVMVGDLPVSAINLTIARNPLWQIPKNCFQNLSNLQRLSLDQNHFWDIQEFAFKNLSHLQFLNLSMNNISHLKSEVFVGLPNLTFLSLTYNKLTELPGDIFLKVSSLSTLFLRHNLFTNFSGIAESVSHLTHLNFLDLGLNNLRSLSLDNTSLPKSLTALNVFRNNLSTLGCNRSLSGIQRLDLSYNSALPTTAFRGVDLSGVNYLRLHSTNVSVLELLNISNINAGHVDFSGTNLNDNTLIELCRSLKSRMGMIKKLRLSNNSLYLTHALPAICPKIEEYLDLSRNKITETDCMNLLTNERDIKIINLEHNHITNLKSCNLSEKNILLNVEELSYRYNRILSVSALAFHPTPNIRTLKLNINTIAYFDHYALSGLKKLETLRLDNNLITDLYINTFMDQVSLKILNLRNNRIATIFSGTFHNLRNLNTLDLGGNKITHFAKSGLKGLHHLTNLYLDGNNLRRIDSSLYKDFQNTLTVLDLQGNQIYFEHEIRRSPFMNLSKLSDLKLNGQRPHGIRMLPLAFFRGLHSLNSLYLSDNQISSLAPNAFDDLTGLRFLTLASCCVGVVQLQPGVFKNLQNLTKLVVENTGILNFSMEVFGNLTQLHTLQLNHNVMQTIDIDTLESLPKLRYLDMRNTPLTCSCQNQFLQNWTLRNPNVQVVYLYNLQCPHDKTHNFYNFDTNVCYIDLEEYLFVSTAVVIILFTVTPLLYNKLYWKMKYGYYVFRSWLGNQWGRLRELEENCKYDAFISYNSSDEEWVMEELLPNLEGNASPFKLCLHHRDFELGRDIVDNIVNAVYSSRKTICIVSKSFLQSEWCSLEIQLASYRLFDEHRDVLLLVFLEPISDRQMSSYHRMRKVMLRKTYLQWPGPDCTNPKEAQELFWNHLRRALRMGSKLETEANDVSEGFVNPNYKDTPHLSDEKYYLQP